MSKSDEITRAWRCGDKERAAALLVGGCTRAEIVSAVMHFCCEVEEGSWNEFEWHVAAAERRQFEYLEAIPY